MKRKLYCDLETFSERDLKKCGTHAYAEVAEVLLFPYAIGDGEVKCWDVTTGEPMPDELSESLEDQGVLTVWHNGGMFDLTILHHAMPKLVLPHERVFDTMACAYAHSLPGSLDTLCSVLGVAADKAKHKTGRQLIQLFCKPRPKNSTMRRATRETHPAEWQSFIEYAKADISAMREVESKIPKWNYQPGGCEGSTEASSKEYNLWLLDQRINSRGVAVDIDLARGAVVAADAAKLSLSQRAQLLTDGAVEAATQRDLLLAHILEEYGVSLPDMQMATLERRLADPDIPEPLKELLSIRLQASTTSVSKYNTLLRATSADGRLRGLLQFCGAGRTGRWSGRTFQPQNLMRPTMKQGDIDFAIDVIRAGACELFYDNVMEVISNTTRGCIVAPEGRKLVISDLANIEGRAAAWLAGEEWKLKAFEAFDNGEGADLYCVAYGKSFNVDPMVVTKSERQIGKVQELMLQYQGRVGAFVTGAATYGIDLDKLAVEAKKNIPPEVWDSSKGFLAWCVEKKMPTYGLSEEAFTACDSLAVLWRKAHPAISSYWPELQDAFRSATESPGKTFHARKVSFRRDGAWLKVKLPSGRTLCYPSPKIVDGGCTYMGLDQYTRKWQRQMTYGGKLFENITQAVARDVMSNAMPHAEAEGYDITLTVHDELITETPDTLGFSADGLSGILATVPPWAEGMPLAAAGFEAYRYRKD